MNKQHFKFMVVVALLIGLTGCATYPPPIIHSDKATNFKYQYSVNIPRGWDAYTKLPKDIKSQMSSQARKMVSLALVNKEPKGMILFMNDKEYTSFDKALERSNSYWQEAANNLKSTMESEAEIVRYQSDIKVENLAATYDRYKTSPKSFKSKPWLEVEADAIFTMGDTTIRYDWFLHPCHKTNSCYTIVVSMSEKDKYEATRKALNEVLESLTMHDLDNN
ncbi:MAG: hypothetical protein KQI78_25370 [Deltaproteobacteria bacterium]|nr:hypothetical protein [Deltaproteobacteria bacterium]